MFTCTVESTINATPDAVFGINSDFECHNELAGSNEVLTVRVPTDGPVGVGTKFEADEDIREPRMMRTKFTAQSEVMQFQPPELIEWRSAPPMGPIYGMTREKVVRRGMEQTMDNLKRMPEG